VVTVGCPPPYGCSQTLRRLVPAREGVCVSVLLAPGGVHATGRGGGWREQGRGDGSGLGLGSDEDGGSWVCGQLTSGCPFPHGSAD
jgi:hypothetical protein